MAAAAAARKLTAVVIPRPPSTDWDLGAKVAAAQVATVIPANNIHSLAPAEMIRRAAIMNRFRIRVCEEARQRGDRTDLEMTASAALLRAGATGLHGVGFLADMRASRGVVAADPQPHLPPQQAISKWSTSSTLTSASRATVPPVVARPVAPQSSSLSSTTARLSPSESPSKAINTPDPNDSFSCQKSIRSQELPAVRPHIVEPAGDEETLSFSATDYSDDFAEPDESDIYSDFSVIFGNGGGSDSSDSAEDLGKYDQRCSAEGDSGAREHVEDYMDDLDGIPWDAR
ncbi:hypothetical protein VPNG_07016 [Cytospora leucostoma]|uniref:Uncharacterized protein n=1 Tax=Cytospora leucostoma TaxID=1230097 RepID=A0A423WNC2_9PEZI|nr:hypothetical protein VPNG_07016 [Cytospora leucostoma]